MPEVVLIGTAIFSKAGLLTPSPAGGLPITVIRYSGLVTGQVPDV